MKLEQQVFLEKIKIAIEIEHELSLNMNFSDLENIDSLTFMIISACIFDNFGIRISAMEVENLKSFEGLYNFINK